ncbi:MAG: GTPase HflX [Desulfotomaculales bacterium]
MKKALVCYLAVDEDDEEVRYDVAEMKELALNIGMRVVDAVVQRRRPDPNYLLGEGKVLEARERVYREQIAAAIFNRELSPRQITRLEELLGDVEVWDRTQVILEIFRRRAQSREGKIQVELARLTYLYPRMLGLGEVLSRLGGGIGTRGPGETKLEVLRRAVRRRIYHLQGELEEIRKNRALLRGARRREGVPVIALVGYTNAGKSTLLNALSLTDNKVLVKDQLFATLDPVSRRIRLPSGREAVLTDTVGFIRDLPPKLKEAFKATLEELLAADLLLHVIDLTSPYLDRQVRAVESLLAELELGDRPLIKVYNKIDRHDGPLPGDGVAVSALFGINLSLLLERIEVALAPWEEAVIVVPFARLGEVARLGGRLQILGEEYLPEGVRISLRGDPVVLHKLKRRLNAE